MAEVDAQAAQEALKSAAESLRSHLAAKDWMETLVMVAPKKAEVADAQDDLKREVAFYESTLSGVLEAIKKFEAIPNFRWRRPDGSRPDEPPFLAEMVKSDAHMAKVKDRLLSDQRKISDAEERKHQREMRKYGKQIQVSKKQDRDKQKKEDMNKIKKWRQGKAGAADVLGEDAGTSEDAGLAGSMGGKRKRGGDEDASAGKRVASAGAGKTWKRGEEPKKSAARQAKDRKFGVGGRKRGMKNNTEETAADMEGYNPRKMKGGKAGSKSAPNAMRGKAGPRGGISKRPGKQRRQQQRGKK